VTKTLISTSFLFAACIANATHADESTIDPVYGDWQGEGLVAQVIPRGAGNYQINFLPGFDVRCEALATVSGHVSDGVLQFERDGWSGRAEAGHMRGSRPVDGEQETFELERVDRPSARVGAKPPENAIVLFDGSGFDQWEVHASRAPTPKIVWELCEDFMRVAPINPQTRAGHSLITKQAFQDIRLHLEFRLALMADKTGQARSNGGVVFEDANWYEVQVLDSYGLEGLDNECGGIYKVGAPAINMCRPPLMWQTYDMEIHAPRYDAKGNRTKPGRISVMHNGVWIHENVELPDSPKARQRRLNNPGGVSSGRIILHYHKDPVEYRNIWVQPLED
jgi:hypothetical protein